MRRLYFKHRLLCYDSVTPGPWKPICEALTVFISHYCAHVMPDSTIFLLTEQRNVSSRQLQVVISRPRYFSGSLDVRDDVTLLYNHPAFSFCQHHSKENFELNLCSWSEQDNLQ